jgi:hypothetical protein
MVVLAGENAIPMNEDDVQNFNEQQAKRLKTQGE